MNQWSFVCYKCNTTITLSGDYLPFEGRNVHFACPSNCGATYMAIKKYEGNIVIVRQDKLTGGATWAVVTAFLVMGLQISEGGGIVPLLVQFAFFSAAVWFFQRGPGAGTI